MAPKTFYRNHFAKVLPCWCSHRIGNYMEKVLCLRCINVHVEIISSNQNTIQPIQLNHWQNLCIHNRSYAIKFWFSFYFAYKSVSLIKDCVKLHEKVWNQMGTKIQYEEKHFDAFVSYVTMIKHIRTISGAAHSRKLIMKMVFLLSTELTFGLKFKTCIQEIPF